MLSGFVDKARPAELVPGATRYGTVDPDGRIIEVFAGDKLAGYAFLTSDHSNTTGYSGKPIHVLVGLDLAGVVTGAKLVDHKEPIVLIGIPVAKIAGFIQGYVGRNVGALAKAAAGGPGGVDIVSGATVTVMVIGDSISRSAMKVARLKHLPGAEQSAESADKRVLDESVRTVSDWQTLVGEGAIRRLHVTVDEVNRAFAASGNAGAASRPESGNGDDAFVELYAALVSQPAIGLSLLGEAGWNTLQQRLKPGQQAIIVMGGGRYSFKGSGYVRGGIFDRVELSQESGTIRFRDRHHERLAELAAAGAPQFPEISIFAIPEEVEFDPARDWTLRLLVQRQLAALDKAFLTFDLGYTLPDRFVRVEKAAPVTSENALWQRIWQERTVSIAVLMVAIAVLTGLFFFQDWFVRRPRLVTGVRFAFLVFSLVWLGWWSSAQLSVVNVLTLAHAVVTDFRWDYFLMDPLVFILWGAVAAALLFWGRGPFCGWLCPFGSLQELAAMAARRLGIRQVTVPWGLHERLWSLKYVIFLGLLAVSLYSVAEAERLAEIEPFKTAIVLHFLRDWWFVLFAVALLAAGLFIERFFCRYLCPLGAALAIPGRLRMFNWLKRYRECGASCRRCGVECPIQAIHPEGAINPNECIYCMHCQVLYSHDQHCPVRLVKARKKRAVRSADADVRKPAEVLPPPANF
ncbi:MAG: NosR/NirI family protein [Magnetospirillum sp.]|nr:NosR/NirI family protein [Magnetospirillum sp.]